MTDKQKNDPLPDTLLQNRRIRQYLINAGLIDRKGKILLSEYDRYVPSDRALPPPRGWPRQERIPRRNPQQVNADSTDDRRQKRPKSIKHTRRPRSIIDRPLSKGIKKRLPSRATSAHGSPSHAHKLDAQKDDSTNGHCRVRMIYYGLQKPLLYKNNRLRLKGDEITIMQQPAGGENVTVFEGYVQANQMFSFKSLRRGAFPFALTLYVNGLVDSRVSVCCENRHKKGVHLGGKDGSFGMYDVRRFKSIESNRETKPKVNKPNRRRRRKSKASRMGSLPDSSSGSSGSSRSSSPEPPRSEGLLPPASPSDRKENKKPARPNSSVDLSHHPSSAPRPASADKGAYATDFDEASDGEKLPAIPQRKIQNPKKY